MIHVESIEVVCERSTLGEVLLVLQSKVKQDPSSIVFADICG